MRSFDFSPLFRSTVGFDRMMRLFDEAMHLDAGAPGYPPYDIAKTGEDTYRISMAVAGFRPDELEVVADRNTLVISGRRQDEQTDAEYLHRGIAARAFERRFELADYIRVSGARLADGMLHVEMVRQLPEELKPRIIQINGGKPEPRRIETQSEKAA